MSDTNEQKRPRMMPSLREPETIRGLLDLFWRTLLPLSVIIAAVFVWYGFWKYHSVQDDLSSAAPLAQMPEAPLDRWALADVLQKLESRRERFDSIQASTSTQIADPR